MRQTNAQSSLLLFDIAVRQNDALCHGVAREHFIKEPERLIAIA